MRPKMENPEAHLRPMKSEAPQVVRGGLVTSSCKSLLGRNKWFLQEWKTNALLWVQTAAPEAHTHVRLGAGHGGDLRLPGQHGGDVEVCDVHVPWRERRTTESVKSIQPGGTRMLLTGSLVCKFFCALGTSSKSSISLSSNQYALQPANPLANWDEYLIVRSGPQRWVSDCKSAVQLQKVLTWGGVGG